MFSDFNVYSLLYLRGGDDFVKFVLIDGEPLERVTDFLGDEELIFLDLEGDKDLSMISISSFDFLLTGEEGIEMAFGSILRS